MKTIPDICAGNVTPGLGKLMKRIMTMRRPKLLIPVVCFSLLGCLGTNRQIPRETKQPDVWWRQPVTSKERHPEWDKFNPEPAKEECGVAELTSVVIVVPAQKEPAKEAPKMCIKPAQPEQPAPPPAESLEEY